MSREIITLSPQFKYICRIDFSRSIFSTFFLLLIIISLSVSSCVGTAINEADINLNDFSAQNYSNLNSNIGRNVCIEGKLTDDTAGIYFALQPIELDGVIDVGFSRLNIIFDNDRRPKRILSRGRRYTVCGDLEESTPFKRCQGNLCKWYRLSNAVLQKR
jgi:hypothetical protein